MNSVQIYVNDNIYNTKIDNLKIKSKLQDEILILNKLILFQIGTNYNL